MKFIAISLLFGSFITGCGQNSAKVELSKDYLRPKVSEIKADTLKDFPGISERDYYCKMLEGNKSAETIIIGAVASQIVKFTSRKVKGQLEKYSNNESLLTDAEFDDFGRCLHIEFFDNKDKKHQVLTIETKGYFANGSAYGMKVRPVWFNPNRFLPEKTNYGNNSKTAIAVSITPTYFVSSTRRTDATLQLFVAKLLSSDAVSGGFFIPQPTNQESKSDWEKRPMLAAPPKGQHATLQFEIVTIVDSPKILTFLDRILTKNEGDIEEELASAISKLAGVEEE